MPDELLAKAFTLKQRSHVGNTEEGFDDYEFLEFLGDRILYMIVVQMLLTNPLNVLTPKIATNISQTMTKNISLACYMDKLDACLVISDNRYNRANTQECADVFEALVGAMYYYLSVSKERKKV